MRFEIKIDKELCAQEPVLTVILFSKSDEEHEKDNFKSGIYNAASEVPSDTDALLSLIELGVNSCLQAHEYK